MYHTCDDLEASNLVIRALPNWGDVTCLNLAESAENLTFLSHPVVKTLLKEKWHGQIQGNIRFIRRGSLSRMADFLRVRSFMRALFITLILKLQKVF